MKQPIRKNITTVKSKKKHPCAKKNNKRKCKYGTSKLEQDFAKDFLDKMGLVYIYQYESKDIKRFYDFCLTCYDDVKYEYEVKDGIKCVKQEGQFFPVDLIIEVDGSWYHSDPRIVDENKLNPMQKHNKFVDGLKDKWAALHGIPLLRIWEYDIRHNPQKVRKEIEKYIKTGKKKRKILEDKKKPH